MDAITATWAEVDEQGRLVLPAEMIARYGLTPGSGVRLETWDFLWALNLRSTLNTCRAVVPAMVARRQGRIINVAAAAALQGQANSAAYAASKSAVVRLTESLSAEVKRPGVNVNAVAPSVIDTPQNRAAMPNADFSLWVTPEALARVSAFLASDAAAPVHGVLLPVFGAR